MAFRRCPSVWTGYVTTWPWQLSEFVRLLRYILLSLVHSKCTELNWTDLHQVDPVTLPDALTGQAPSPVSGCSETRTVSAQSFRALWTTLLKDTCSELEFNNSGQFCSVRVPWTNLCATKPHIIYHNCRVAWHEASNCTRLVKKLT